MGRFQRLAILFHRRWAVPVLAELHRGRGAKFVTLVSRLGISRDVARQTLDALVEHHWVKRNPGYGHPMRPEYLLTARGAKLAPACARLLGTLRRLGLERVGLRKWTLPVVLAIRGSGTRFNELKGVLPGITARALTLALKSLEEASLVERSIADGHPPYSTYRLTRRGRNLAPAVERL